MIRFILMLLPFYLSLIMVFGCSSGKLSPVTPQEPASLLSPDIPITDYSENDHSMLGSWSLKFDIKTLTSSIESNRTMGAHHNVTGMIPDPLIIINGWDPVEEVIDVDIQIHNPFLINAYDVRLIIYTDDAGHTLLNADEWTPLWDIPGGRIANPFKAYAKYEQNRIFTGLNWHQENFRIKCPGLNFTVQFAVDASFPDNCEEPYEITDFTQGFLSDQAGYSTNVEITVRDWQEDVSEVQLYCPEILGGALLTFDQINPERWNAELINETGAPAGEYKGYIIAKSTNSGSLALYDEIAITISDGTNVPSNPQIVATIGTMSKCIKVELNGNYAFCASDDEGVKIFDIRQPCSPNLVSSIESEMARDVAVNNGFLYIADALEGFKIVDVSDIFAPVDAGLLPSLNSVDVVVSGNYAYVMSSLGFTIVDVTDPYNPEIIPNSLDISYIYDMTIDVDCLYLCLSDYSFSGLKILDISNPASPVIIQEIQDNYTHAVDVVNGFAYVAIGNELKILDVADPGYAQEVGSIFVDDITDIASSGDYVFITCESFPSTGSFKVVDVNDPTTPVELGEVDIRSPGAIVAKGNYAFVADDMERLRVVDANNPNEPWLCGYYRLSTVQDVIVENGYAYIVARYDGIYIIDIAEPSTPIVVGHIDANYDLTGADVEGDFLYYADHGALLIADISNPAVPEQVGYLYITDLLAWNLKVRGDYAYIPAQSAGFFIVDISNPADPEIVGGDSTIFSACDLVLEDNYVYLTRSHGGYRTLQILDISDPTDIFTVGSWSTYDARGIAKQDQYVYVGHYDIEVLNILDVSDSTLPVEASSVSTAHDAGDVAVQGNYAYIAGFEPAGGGGLEIVDITDPTMPVLFSSLTTDGHASGIAVEGNYAYLADLDGGLKVIKLW